MILKEIFGNKKIAALVGEKSSGKTNNLMAMVKDFRDNNSGTHIYYYGMDDVTSSWINKLGRTYEISKLRQLSNKRNCLIIIDEFYLLKLNDRRHKAELDEFINFIYHNNNWLILSSPDERDFNTVIGSKIERWLFKSFNISNLINGSQVKDEALAYNGRYKSLDRIEIPKNKVLVMNDEHEIIIELKYIKEIDKKPEYIDIFKLTKKK